MWPPQTAAARNAPRPPFVSKGAKGALSFAGERKERKEGNSVNCTIFGQGFSANQYNCWHQMSYSKAKMHQIRFWLELCPRPHCGAYRGRGGSIIWEKRPPVIRQVTGFWYHTNDVRMLYLHQFSVSKFGIISVTWFVCCLIVFSRPYLVWSRLCDRLASVCHLSSSVCRLWHYVLTSRDLERSNSWPQYN